MGTPAKVITKKAGAYTAPKTEADHASIRQAKYESRRNLVTVPEKISGNKNCEMNAIIWQLKEKYPQDSDMFHIEFMYPWAQGGPLYVDFCNFDDEIQKCKKKAEVMKIIGLRYLVMKPQMTEDMARAQLAGAPIQ